MRVSMRSLVLAATTVVLASCGGGGGGAPTATPPPPAPGPSRDTYARLALSTTGIAIIDPATPSRLIVVEPENTVRDSKVVYEADIDAAGNATNVAVRYVLYVKQGRLYRYDLRDRGAPVQVGSATDLCEIAMIDGAIDIDRVGLLLFTTGPNGLCNFGTSDDGRVFATARMDATVAPRSLGASGLIPIHTAPSTRAGWLMFEPATVGGVVGYSFSYMPSSDFAATSVAVGFVAGTLTDTFEASGGLYMSNAFTYKFFNPLTRTIVDAPQVNGFPFGRDAAGEYLLDGNAVKRVDRTGTGPATPTTIGVAPVGFAGIGVANGFVWFTRNTAPRDLMRMPVSGGAAELAGTFAQPFTGFTPARFSLAEFGSRTIVLAPGAFDAVVSSGGGLAALSMCCHLNYQLGGIGASGVARIEAAVFGRPLAGGGSELIALTPTSNVPVSLGPVPAAAAGLIGIEFGPNWLGRNYGSLATFSRSGIPASGGPRVYDAMSARPASAGSLVLAVP